MEDLNLILKKINMRRMKGGSLKAKCNEKRKNRNGSITQCSDSDNNVYYDIAFIGLQSNTR